MQLHLIRHGQTDWNEERRVQGQSESQLTELGIAQAKGLVEKLQHLQFEKIYCSSSLRTRQTAQHAFGLDQNGSGQQIEYLDSLREIHLGPWEGQLYADIEVSDPDSYIHFWQQPHLFDVTGAETFHQLQARILSAVKSMASRWQLHKIAIVSHGAIIKSLLCHLQQRPLSELWAPPQMHNCAHSIIEINGEGNGHIIQYADQEYRG